MTSVKDDWSMASAAGAQVNMLPAGAVPSSSVQSTHPSDGAPQNWLQCLMDEDAKSDKGFPGTREELISKLSKIMSLERLCAEQDESIAQVGILAAGLAVLQGWVLCVLRPE